MKYQYCPQCKGDLESKTENLLQCTTCSYQFYINPKPTTAIIFENKFGEILFVKRKIDPFKGRLDLPGGFIDLNENAEGGGVREIKEELGINIQTPSYFRSYYGTYEFEEVTYPTLCLVFIGKLSDEEIRPSDDISGFIFIKKEDIKIEELAFFEVRQAIKDYLDLPSSQKPVESV